jgi:hypothetical protein
MERTDQRMNLHRIILRRQVPVEENISGDFTTQKVSFPYNPSGCLDARVRTPSSETQSRKESERLSGREPQRASHLQRVRTLIR